MATDVIIMGGVFAEADECFIIGDVMENADEDGEFGEEAGTDNGELRRLLPVEFEG
jgi:hypothetical protein